MEIKDDEKVLLKSPEGNKKICILAILLINVCLPMEETNVFRAKAIWKFSFYLIICRQLQKLCIELVIYKKKLENHLKVHRHFVYTHIHNMTDLKITANHKYFSLILREELY